MKTALLFLAMVGTLQGQMKVPDNCYVYGDNLVCNALPVGNTNGTTFSGQMPQCSINGGKPFPARPGGCYAEDAKKPVAGSADGTPKPIVNVLRGIPQCSDNGSDPYPAVYIGGSWECAAKPVADGSTKPMTPQQQLYCTQDIATRLPNGDFACLMPAQVPPQGIGGDCSRQASDDQCLPIVPFGAIRPDTGQGSKIVSDEEFYRSEIARLQAENAALRDTNEHLYKAAMIGLHALENAQIRIREEQRKLDAIQAALDAIAKGAKP